MHTLLSTEQAMMDRYVTLENLETGTMDYCFDRSNFPEDSHPGFYFMKQGGVYDCRILLFGRTTFKEGVTFVDCRVLDPNVKMGNCRFVKVAVGEDIYYVYYKDVRDVIKKWTFSISFGTQGFNTGQRCCSQRLLHLRFLGKRVSLVATVYCRERGCCGIVVLIL